MSTNKSFSTETSERYSRALFEVAIEANELDKTENDVRNFQLLFNSSSEIKNFIQNPTQSKNTQNIVINLLTNNMGFSKNMVFASVVALSALNVTLSVQPVGAARSMGGHDAFDDLDDGDDLDDRNEEDDDELG